jgi:hypothetical protein
LINKIPNFKKFVEHVDEIIIELLEDKPIPPLRLNYMARTGLFFDMMPHILIPIQILFAGKTVTYTAEKIVVGYYKGFDTQVSKWLANKTEKIDVRYETYFSLQLKLKISNKQGNSNDENTREVNLFVRSGKEMTEERKWAILKHKPTQNNKTEQTEGGIVTIYINDDRFDSNAASGVVLPKQTPSKHIRGHARIFYDVMNYLSTLKKGSKKKSKVVELLNVDSAVEVIKSIEDIKSGIRDWPKVEDMEIYETGELILNDNSEIMFLRPSEFLNPQNCQ